MDSHQLEFRAEISRRSDHRCLRVAADRHGGCQDHAALDAEAGCVARSEGWLLATDAQRAVDWHPCSARPPRPGELFARGTNLAAGSFAGNGSQIGWTTLQ